MYYLPNDFFRLFDYLTCLLVVWSLLAFDFILLLAYYWCASLIRHLSSVILLELVCGFVGIWYWLYLSVDCLGFSLLCLVAYVVVWTSVLIAGWCFLLVGLILVCFVCCLVV